MTPQPAKTFDLPPPEVGPRVVYEVRGHVLDGDGEPAFVDGEASMWSETFTTIPRGTVPAGVLVDLSAGVRIVDAQVLFTGANVTRFLRATLQPADRGRFDAMVRDERKAVNVGQLGDIAMWLTEELGRVPSGGPSN